MSSSPTNAAHLRNVRVAFAQALKPDDTNDLKALLENQDVLRHVDENYLRELLGRAIGHGNEDAVSLLLAANAKTDVTAGYGPIHRAIRNQKAKSRCTIINLLLDHNSDVDFRDADGKTPLMVATLRGQLDVVITLLAHGADPNAVDNKGKNILHRMASDSPPGPQWSPDLLSLLVTKVTDREERDAEGRSPLLWAAAKGSTQVAGALLPSSGAKLVNVNQVNDHGDTALHLAARNNQPDMIKLLLFSGANIEATSDGKWTPLLVAAKAGHEAAIDALLTHVPSAYVNARTSSGMTALHWAAENGKLAAVQRILKVPSVHKNIKDSFDSTPLIRAAQRGHWDIVEELRPLVLQGPTDRLARKACERFRAAVVNFFQDDRSPTGFKSKVDRHTVWQVLYARGKDPHKFAIPTIYDDIESRKPDFRWIHLPANNLSWLEAILTKHFLERRSKDLSPLKALLRLFGRQQHRGSKVHSRFMRPSCKRIPITRTRPLEMPELNSATSRRSSHSTQAEINSALHSTFRPRPPSPASMTGPQPPPPRVQGSVQPQQQQEVEDMIVVFMPYLHWESDENRRALTQSIRLPRHQMSSIGAEEMARVIKDELLIHGYPVDRSTELHPRRTLDQFKHHSTDTDPQDVDQVVYRYCKNNNEEAKIYMVDQLWLVTVGDLLITCFPERWGQPRRDPLNLFDGVVEDINSTTRPPVRNVYELSILITERCTGVFDRHQWGDEELLFAEMFELSIGILTRKETALFSRFKNDSMVAAHWLKEHGKNSALYEKQLVSPQEDYAHQHSAHLDSDIDAPTESTGSIAQDHKLEADEFVNKLLNIDEEAALLVECKDIEDELEILSNVLRQQKQVLKNVEDELRGSKTVAYHQRLDAYTKLGEQQRLVDADITDLARMARQARSVNDNLTQILDLKQKHANAVEARFQRVQAQETARQGQTLMVFTVVTIVFLPLSFLATVFTIDIIEFPRPPDSGSGELHLGWVLKYVLGIGLGVSVPLIFFAFVVGDLKAWWARRGMTMSHSNSKQASSKSDDGVRDVSHLGLDSRWPRAIRGRRRVEAGDGERGEIEDDKMLPFQRPPTLNPRISRNSVPTALPNLVLPNRPALSSMESDRSANPIRRLRRTVTDRTEMSAATEDLEVGRT
ncbi:hypothetical protein PV10_06066 [Exophiala mesophila]|uniref:Uncharacterized protein n=1 Tax=Exophiala mesophila TaxID=212818 RepID=A0A0D1ZA49_EXOME|nr:uncharacterized protein PV10_06066 [Exophiala mesophila]KIV91537.1 hypothetical protein PV10_06066 [Exophiala mesophila]